MAAFTAQLPNVMSQLGTSIMNSAATGGTAGLNAQSRATLTLGNKQRVVQKKEAGKQVHFGQRPERWFDNPGRPVPEFEHPVGLQSHVQWNNHPRQSSFQVCHSCNRSPQQFHMVGQSIFRNRFCDLIWSMECQLSFGQTERNGTCIFDKNVAGFCLRLPH